MTACFSSIPSVDQIDPWSAAETDQNPDAHQTTSKRLLSSCQPAINQSYVRDYLTRLERVCESGQSRARHMEVAEANQRGARQGRT